MYEKNESFSFKTMGFYLGLVLIWSTTPLAVVVSLRELTPIWSLMLRFVFALMLSGLALCYLRLPLILNQKTLRAYVAGSMGIFGAMLFTYLGAQYLPSGLVSLIFGLAPLVAGMLGQFVFRNTRLMRVQWIALVIAVVGLIGIFDAQPNHGHQSIGVLYMLLAVLCYVVSIFWVKHENSGVHPMVQTTGSLLISSLCALILLPFVWSDRPTVLHQSTIIAVGYSVVFASVLAMFIYFSLVNTLTPATLSLATVITPVIALFLGVWLNHEVLTPAILAWIVLILMALILYFYQEWIRLYRYVFK